MPLHDAQEILARLYVDRAFRERFFADREAALRSLSLTTAEIQTLRLVSQEQVERFAHSLHSKRRTEVRELIPWSVAALGAKFPLLFSAHCDRYTPTGLRKPGDDAHVFCATLAQDRTLDRLTREVLRWEALRWEHCHGERPRGLRVFRFCPQRARSSETGETRYLALPGWTLIWMGAQGWRTRSWGSRGRQIEGAENLSTPQKVSE